MIGKTSGASRFNNYEFSEMRSMEKEINKRDGFVVDVFFYFALAQQFECRGDMFSFGISFTVQAREFCNLQ